MSLSAVRPRVVYAGSGTTGPFAVSYNSIGIYYRSNAHIKVKKMTSAGVVTTLTENVDYTLTAAPSSSGAVTLAVALAVGEKIAIYRDQPYAQDVSIAGNFAASDIAAGYDRLEEKVQEIGDKSDRAVKLSPFELIGADPTIPPLVANKALAVNEDGDGFIWVYNDAALVEGAAAAAAASQAAAAASQTAAATSATAAATSATASATSATAAAASAATAASLVDQVLFDPSVSDAIAKNNTIILTRADGAYHAYKATKAFTWSDPITHEYAASPPDMVPLSKGRRLYGACVTPSGYASAPFGVYYGPQRIETDVDNDDLFRATYLPSITAGNVFYLDKAAGTADAFDGKSWAKAFVTYTAAQVAIVAAGNGILYIKGSATAYGRNEGLSHSGIISVSHALIGVPDASGNPVTVGNLYEPSEVSFAPVTVDTSADFTITGITKANPAVVTTSTNHGFVNGDRVIIYGADMTEVNGIVFTVAGKTNTTFQLSGINSTGYTTYTTGGKTTHKFIYVTATGTMSQPGRVCDIKAPKVYVDYLGRSHSIPSEYAVKTSKAAVYATPGSYWFDSANTNFYVNMIGGGAPTLNTDLLIQRSTVNVFLGDTGRTVYREGIRFVGGTNQSANKSTSYALNCLSLYALDNGIGVDNFVAAGTKGCVTIDPTNDGYNYHSTGANITGITKANPAVVTTTSDHHFSNGDTVLIASSAYGVSIGMTQVDGLTFTVANATSTTFELSGINSTSYGTYTSGAYARVPTTSMFALNDTAIRSGTSEGSNQSMSCHEHVKGLTINGLYVEPYRDHVTNIGTSEHRLINTMLQGTRVTTPDVGNPNRFVNATDAAKVALDRVPWGGYAETSSPLFSGNSNNKIKLLNTEMPQGSSNYSNVSATY